MFAKTHTTGGQRIFKDVFIGTLIYAVVLGFFNDYTAIVYAKSFSYLFLASLVLELLTLAAFWLKKVIIAWVNGRHVALTIFGVWLVLFVSKFVFIWVIDVIFGDDVNIYGFFGILAVVASVTIVNKLAEYIYAKLGQDTLRL